MRFLAQGGTVGGTVREPADSILRRRLGHRGFQIRPAPFECGPSAQLGGLLLPNGRGDIWAQPVRAGAHLARARTPRSPRPQRSGDHAQLVAGFLGVTGLAAAWLLLLVIASR